MDCPYYPRNKRPLTIPKVMSAPGNRLHENYRTRLQEALHANLDFHGSNGKHTIHAWHPFPAKFPPQLPQFFIEHFTSVDDVVLDPMAGSGTTLVEAARLNRQAIGCDIDPLARMIATAKLTPINAGQALETGTALIHAAQRALHQDRTQLEDALNLRFDPKTRAFIDFWFLPQQQLELLALLQGIEKVPQEGLQAFFKIVFSSTIIAKSGGVSLARDLAHTRPHKVLDKKPNSAFVEFTKRLKQNLGTNAADTATPKHPARVLATGAADTGLPSDSVDLIVTSPPYANNAIDYMRAHKFSLVWFGWHIDDLSGIRARYLGHDTAGATQFDGLPRQCEATLTQLTERDTKKAAALRRYFGEMCAVIEEMWRVLKKGKPAVIVVGSSNLRGLDVETHKGLAALGEKVGFELAGIGVRRLDRDKRMMPARWGSQRHSQIEERMHQEYVIGLVKS